MFDDVAVVFLEEEKVTAFRKLAIPICRKLGYDDVLPDPPEHVQQYVYSMVRPPTESEDGDANNAFVGGLQHDGLVILSEKQLPYIPQLPAPGRFPWHPWCEHFARRGCSVSASTLQKAAARQYNRTVQQQQVEQSELNHQPPNSSQQLPLAVQQQCQPKQHPGAVQLVATALHMDDTFLQEIAAAVLQHNRNVQQEWLNAWEQEQRQQQEQQHVTVLQELLERQRKLLRSSSVMQAQAQQQPQQVPRVLLMPLLLQTVQQAAAAAAIQSSWRAHRCRLTQKVAERALVNRAVRAIQRAWRAFLLRQRLRLLSGAAAAWQSGLRLRFSSMMCVDVASRRLVDAAAERGKTGHGMFPEHRLRFVIDNDGNVLLVDMTASSNASRSGSSTHDNNSEVADVSNNVSNGSRNAAAKSSSSSRAAPVMLRLGLPKWLGIDIPVISPAAATKVLEDQMWFEPFGRADAGKLLEIGCDSRELLSPSMIATPGVHPTEVAQLVTFKSPQQAAVRAALLAALTYDVKAHCGCRLLSVQDSALGAAYKAATALPGSVTSTPRQRPAAAATTTSAVTESAAQRAKGTSKEAATSLKAATGKGRHTGKKDLKGGSKIKTGDGSSISTAAPSASASCAAVRSAAPINGATDAAVSGLVKSSNISGWKSSVNSTAAASGSSTARIAAAATAAYEDQVAAEAKTAVEAAMAALHEIGTADQSRTMYHQLAALPIRPTSTLTAAAAEVAAAAAAVGTATADPATAAASATPGGVTFETHVFSLLPYLQKLAAAAEAQAETAAAVQGTENTRVVPSKQVEAASLQAAKQKQQQGLESCDGATVAGGPCPANVVKLAESIAEYLAQIKLAQTEAFRVKLAAETADAKAAAEAELACKQEAVAAARAAAADTSGQWQSSTIASFTNCLAPGYWPDTVSAAAEAAQGRKQQQQQAAGELVQLQRQQQIEERGEMLRQQADVKAAAQLKAQEQAQALQQQVVQQYEQQHEAASIRVALLKDIRKSSKAAAQMRLQFAGAINRQCNLLNKHISRGNMAVVRAATLKSVADKVEEQRQVNSQEAALAQQRKDMASSCKSRVSQDRSAAKAELLAAKAIAAIEQAVLRAKAAAQRLLEQETLKRVGPAGGVLGSAQLEGIVRQPMHVTCVGNVAASNVNTPCTA